ncbi:hypothetical protein A2U01_0016757, partial [Trifolium medium]|nr:hypothetical protein [Trifolium medium]
MAASPSYPYWGCCRRCRLWWLLACKFVLHPLPSGGRLCFNTINSPPPLFSLGLGLQESWWFVVPWTV